ncbi:MAG: hypothetical protein HYX27_06735 [Acidobacteria bacterium]|nr:hypothetical protein [Acidobacteriota bacterium]
MNEIVNLYWLHVIVIGSALAVTVYRHLYNLLAPAPAFCIALTYSFFSDFLVRGYEDSVVAVIPPAQLLAYQLIVLAVYVLTVATALSLRPSPGANISPRYWNNGVAEIRCELVGWGGAILDIVKRLVMTEWDVAEAISQSLGPRGGNSWSSGASLGDGTFILAATLILLPASGVCFGTLLTSPAATFTRRIRAAAGLLLILALLYSYGSRTYFAVPLIYACARYSYASVSLLRRCAVWVALAALIAVVFSMMYQYRSGGINALLERGQPVEVGNIQYHQDDSYYRILYAAYIAETTNESLDASHFFYTIAVNPIPRYFWNDKPALLDDFWLDYKPYYVTMTFLGESIALFGLWAGPIASLFFLFALYRLLTVCYSTVMRRPLGLGVYFIVLFYVSQCLRSMMSLTMSLYFPFAILALSLILKGGRTVRRPLLHGIGSPVAG